MPLTRSATLIAALGAACVIPSGAPATASVAKSTASVAKSTASTRSAAAAKPSASKKSGKTKTKRVARKPAARGPKLPRGVRLLAYSGGTGAVLHVRSSQAGTAPATGRTAWSSVSESWTELGGGQRQRQLWTQLPRPGSSDIETVVESWSNPQLSVIRFTPAADSGRTAPAPAGDLRCASTADLAAVGARTDIERVQRAQARVASGEALPAGPAIEGRATVIVDGGPLTSPIGNVPVPGSLQLVLDRVTSQLLRQIYNGADGRQDVTDFDVWELLPAGGSDTELGRPVPADTKFNPAPDCELTDRWVRGEF